MESTIPLWITSGTAIIGVIYAIVRNGSRGKKQDDELKTELKTELGTIKTQLSDPENGLSAIKKSVDEQKLHCVETSTGLSEKVKTNSKEIENLRKRKK